MNNTREPLQETFGPYDLFMVFVSILSFINIALYLLLSDQAVLYVIGAIDFVLSGFFLIDFSKRFVKSKSKRGYFFNNFGWADLLASVPLPQFNILRVFRLFKSYWIVKRIGVANVSKGLIKNSASSALFTILFLIILLLEFGSIGILYAERTNADLNIATASDALWWVYVTITTVGYGDTYPVSQGGRIIGMLVMLAGVGLFGVLTGYLANKFIPQSEESKDYDAELNDIRKSLHEIKNLITSEKK
jgi:voltage-gated potassium channel